MTRDQTSSMLRLSIAAAELGVSTDTLRRWADNGKITMVRTLGGHRRITDEEVDRIKREMAR